MAIMNATFSNRQLADIDDMAQKLNTDAGGVLSTALSLLSVSLRETADGSSEIGFHNNGQVKKVITGLRAKAGEKYNNPL